jgi:hypothetical protein
MSAWSRVVLVAVMSAVAIVAVIGSAGARDQRVTIGFQRYYDAGNRVWKMRFFGSISGDAVNEYVAVLQQRCGLRYSTAVAGAQTNPGGGWETDTYLGGASATYRARWNSDVSDPVTFRPPLVPEVRALGGSRFRARVFPYWPENDPQAMKGRPVVLQWLTAGQWMTVRTARLGARKGTPSLPDCFATFSYALKGSTLRVLVPRKSALPCYAAGVSKTFRS